MQHSLVVEFRCRAMLARGDLVITRGLLVLGARGMDGVRHVGGFVQAAPPSTARLCDAVLSTHAERPAMRSSARCRESLRVKLASMANVVIQDRRRRNPPRANVDLGIELARSARREAILLNIAMPRHERAPIHEAAARKIRPLLALGANGAPHP